MSETSTPPAAATPAAKPAASAPAPAAAAPAGEEAQKKSLLATETAPSENGEGAGKSAPEAAAPVEYKLTIPEKSGLVESDIKAVTDLAKELKLTNEQAQKLVQVKADDRNALVQSLTSEQQQSITKTQEAWESEFKADKEFGNEKLATSLKNARRVLSTYADPKWVEALERSPLGSEPGFLRLLSRIGARMGEDAAPSNRESPTAERSPQDILYPHFAAKKSA